MPTLSNGIVYQDLGTRDAAEMAEYQRQERERRRQQQQQNAGGTAAPQPTATPSQTDGQTAQQPSAPQQTRGVSSNVGADPFAAVVRRRFEQDRNLGREDADLAYSQWKDTVDTAFSNGQAAARDKNKGVYNAGYTLWNTIEAINNGEFDLNDENDKKRAQFMIQQAASQFGSIVAENHGWTLVDGDGAQGFSGFDGKNFNFYFKDRNGNTISRSMSPQSLRKTLEKQGLVDKADNDPTKKVSTTELDAKYFKNGWDDSVAMSITEDKTLPSEYRQYVRKRLYDSMVSQAVKDAEARWTQEMDKRYAASVANADAQNKYNAAVARNGITQEIKNDGRQQINGATPGGMDSGNANVGPSFTNVSDAEAAASGESRVPEFTPMPEDNRGSFYDSDAYKEALARFNEDWEKRARGADLDEKKSGSEGNLAKAWGSGEGGINGDAETDPEVIELRRREKNGTLSESAARRLAELTGSGATEKPEELAPEVAPEEAAAPEPEVPESVKEARARAQAARDAAERSRQHALDVESEANRLAHETGLIGNRESIDFGGIKNWETGETRELSTLSSKGEQTEQPSEPSTPAEEPVAEQEQMPEQSEEAGPDTDESAKTAEKNEPDKAEDVKAKQEQLRKTSDSIADRFDIPPEKGKEARWGLGWGNRALKDKERGGKPSTRQIVDTLKEEIGNGIKDSRLSKLVDDMFKEYNTAWKRNPATFDPNLTVRIAAQRHNMNPEDAVALLNAIEEDSALRERFLRNYQR